MLTFKKFVNEETTWHKMHSISNPDLVDYHHSARIGGKTVVTHFMQNDDKKKSYDVHFTVDGQTSAHPGAKPEKRHATHIIRHVMHSVKEFHAKHKPHELRFRAHDDAGEEKTQKKHNIYTKIAQRLGHKVNPVRDSRTAAKTGDFKVALKEK